MSEETQGKKIAMHWFVETINGRACSNCGKKWVDISWANRSHVGQLGISHVGALTEGEADEIVAEVNATWIRGMG
jgi:hypothetical protein